MKKLMINNKEISNINKRINKNIFITSLAFVLLLSLSLSGITFVSTKSFAKETLKPRRYESVYVSLDNFGTPKEATMYVDTMLNGTKKIVDNGRFKSVENMSNKLSPIYDKSGNLVWDLTSYNEESFAYNVVLDKKTFKNIPWTFDISYELNGKEIDPGKLAHSNGLIKVIIDIKPNSKAPKFYKNNYAMEITADFDMNKYISVTSKDAIEMMTGKTKTMLFVVVPGASNTIELMLGSEDFCYDGLTFAMMPITGELSSKIVDLVRDKKDLEDAYRSSMNATDTVLNALGAMTNGFNEAASGLASLKTGTIKMHDLKGNRDMAIDELDSELSKLTKNLDETCLRVDSARSKVTDLFSTLKDLNKETKNLEKSLNYLEDNVHDLSKISGRLGRDANDAKKLTKSLRGAVDDSKNLLSLLLASSEADTSEITAAMVSLQTNLESAGALMQQIDYTALDAADQMKFGGISQALTASGMSLQELAEKLQSLSSLTSQEANIFNSLKGDLSSISKYMKYVEDDLSDLEKDAPIFEELVDSSESLLSDLEGSIKIVNKYMDKQITYEDDVNKALDNLYNITCTLNEITTTLSVNVPTLKEGLNIMSTDLYNGAVNTAGGLYDVTRQMANVTNQTSTFMNAKNKVDKIITTNWKDIDEKSTIFEMNPNETKISFSSSENSEPEKVQIFLKTPEIKEIVDDDLAIFETEKTKEGIWARIWSLFVKVYKFIFRK